MSAPLQLVGQRFGRLTAVREIGRLSPAGRLWECICECGTVKQHFAGQLRRGAIKSCGCLLKEKAGQRSIERSTTHGKSKTPQYQAWSTMLARCRNPRVASFKNYGARGITVCERWLSFENFFADVGDRPPGASLERKNNDGNYEPGNVVWATAQEQARNRRSNVVVAHDGMTATIAEWSDRTGLSQVTISERLRAGWPASKALTAPPRVTNRKAPNV